MNYSTLIKQLRSPDCDVDCRVLRNNAADYIEQLEQDLGIIGQQVSKNLADTKKLIERANMLIEPTNTV